MSFPFEGFMTGIILSMAPAKILLPIAKRLSRRFSVLILLFIKNGSHLNEPIQRYK